MCACNFNNINGSVLQKEERANAHASLWHPFLGTVFKCQGSLEVWGLRERESFQTILSAYGVKTANQWVLGKHTAFVEAKP